MNKLFAFLCFNTLAFTLHTEENSEQSTNRGINFESWSNFTQKDEYEETERTQGVTLEEEEE